MTGSDPSESSPGPTPETILAHELVGLRVRVVEATNGDLVGVAGRVVEETTNTLRIGDEDANGESATDGRVRTVPKAAATFEFELPTEGERTGGERERSERDPHRTALRSEGGSRSTSGRKSDGEYVTVEGRRLVSRPARRTKDATGGKTWHSV